MKTVYMYTDGACFPNPGKGAWAVLLVSEDRQVRKLFTGIIPPKVTNNVAEIVAAMEGLKRLKEPCFVHLYSDSMYMLNCASGEWQRNSNPDWWMQFDEVALPHTIEYHWIKGHAGHPENELVNDAAEKVLRNDQ